MNNEVIFREKTMEKGIKVEGNATIRFDLQDPGHASNGARGRGAKWPRDGWPKTTPRIPGEWS